MGNPIGKFFVVLIAVFLLFIYPLMHMFQTQEDTTRILVSAETTEIVDAIRNLGFLTPDMYQEFTTKLSATGNIYRIDVEHRHKSYDPVYDDPMDLTTFGDAYQVNYDEYGTKDIMAIIFPDPPSTQFKYNFSEGDFVLIRVVNQNKTLATKIRQLIYGRDLPLETIVVQYGGMIK